MAKFKRVDKWEIIDGACMVDFEFDVGLGEIHRLSIPPDSDHIQVADALHHLATEIENIDRVDEPNVKPDLRGK